MSELRRCASGHVCEACGFGMATRSHERRSERAMNETNRGPWDITWPAFDVYAAEGVLSNVSRHAWGLMGRPHCPSIRSGIATWDKSVQPRTRRRLGYCVDLRFVWNKLTWAVSKSWMWHIAAIWRLGLRSGSYRLTCIFWCRQSTNMPLDDDHRKINNWEVFRLRLCDQDPVRTCQTCISL